MEEIIDTSGFYKFEPIQNEWFFGPNKVINNLYVLERDLKDTYTYPIDGWTWYDEEPLEYTEYIQNLYNI